MNKMIRKRLKRWSKTPVKIAIMGLGRSGKSTLIKKLLGEDATYKYNLNTKTQEYKNARNENLTMTEISLPENNRMRESFAKEVKLENFNAVILVTSSWFTEALMWITRNGDFWKSII